MSRMSNVIFASSLFTQLFSEAVYSEAPQEPVFEKSPFVVYNMVRNRNLNSGITE